MTASLMDPLYIILPFLWGTVSCSFNWTSALVTEVTVRHGDNITLYCDCRMETRGPTAWFRKCSHENQPVLVLDRDYFFQNHGKSQLTWTKNDSSDSFDLTIINVTDSDEGFYYCATEERKVEDNECIDQNSLYHYSNTTRKISIKSTEPHVCICEHQQDYSFWWKLILFLCPAIAFLSLFFYRLCKKHSNSNDQNRHLLRQTNNQDDTPEIHHPSVGVKRKNATHTSTCTTYSVVQYTSNV